MNDKAVREEFATGLKKIRLEIKSRLVPHGPIRHRDGRRHRTGRSGRRRLENRTRVKGRTVNRSFDRGQIEGCRLRVGGDVLLAIISMIDEVSNAKGDGAAGGSRP